MLVCETVARLSARSPDPPRHRKFTHVAAIITRPAPSALESCPVDQLQCHLNTPQPLGRRTSDRRSQLIGAACISPHFGCGGSVGFNVRAGSRGGNGGHPSAVCVV